MFEVFLLVGGIWFWVLSLLFTIAIIKLLNSEEYGIITVVTVVAGVVYYLTGRGGEVVSYYMKDPVAFLTHVGLYLAIGIVYSTFKWFLFIREKKNTYIEDKKVFMERESNKDKEESVLKEEWKKSFGDFKRFTMYLTPSCNKSKIGYWIAYWPWSLLWLVLCDFISGLTSFIVRKLGFIYSSISKGQFSDIEDDLK